MKTQNGTEMQSLWKIKINPFNLQNGIFVEPKQHSHTKKSCPTTNLLNCPFGLQESCHSTCIFEAHPSPMIIVLYS